MLCRHIGRKGRKVVKFGDLNPYEAATRNDLCQSNMARLACEIRLKQPFRRTMNGSAQIRLDWGGFPHELSGILNSYTRRGRYIYSQPTKAISASRGSKATMPPIVLDIEIPTRVNAAAKSLLWALISVFFMGNAPVRQLMEQSK